MKIALRLVTLALLATCVGSFAADETEKKKPKASASIADRSLKRLEAAELTEDQVAKIRELAVAADKKIGDLKAAAALTDEQKAAQKTATQAAKDSGKDKKEARAAVSAALKLTDAQTEAQKGAKAASSEFNKAVQELLTDDQKAKLKAAPGKTKPEKKKKS